MKVFLHDGPVNANLPGNFVRLIKKKQKVARPASVSWDSVAPLLNAAGEAVVQQGDSYLSEDQETKPRFLIGDDLVPAKELDRTFVGTVVIDQEEQGERGLRWHLGVKPEGIVLQGDTGAFHSWIPWTGEVPGEKSTAGQVLTSMREANLMRPDGTRYAPACGELIGVRGRWDRRDLDYGPSRNKDDKGKHIIAKGVIFLLEHYPDESVEEETGPVLTDAEMLTVVNVVDGKNFKAIRMAAHNDVDDNELRVKILNKSALEYAVEQGYLTVDDDNVYHTTVPVEGPATEEAEEPATV